jgi:hypothetical protein
MQYLEPIRVFISSKQSEFRDERRKMAEIIEEMPLLAPILAEDWAPERLEVREKFLGDVRRSPIYVGLFGEVYSQPTVLEYETARENPCREILIYIRKHEPTAIDPRLAPLLAQFQDRHTCKCFETAQDLLPFFEKHLWNAIRVMVESYVELQKAAPVTHGADSPQKRKWVARRGYLTSLGLPGDLSPNSAAQYTAQLSDLLKGRTLGQPAE